MKKLGFIVNPISGMGGSVGLKGTDGEDILKKAIDLGAVPKANLRAKVAINALEEIQNNIEIYTCPCDMGENILNELNFDYKLVEIQLHSKTTYLDTEEAARKMLHIGIDLILFAGGDGTARNIYNAVENKIITLGIPTGVKIHSAVFAQNPENAGKLAKLFLDGKIKKTEEAEVMDINEEDYRQEILSARLYGYLKIPLEKRYTQNLKSGSPASEKYYQNAIAHDVVESMNNEYYYLIGPGSTTRSVMEKLNLENSLLGVDLVYKKKLIGKDLTEKGILAQIKGKKAKLIITPVGGQGYLLGRGNQQLSPEVIEKIGKNNITITATIQKITELSGKALLVDTGNEKINKYLKGYYKIITGYHQSMIYRVV